MLSSIWSLVRASKDLFLYFTNSITWTRRCQASLSLVTVVSVWPCRFFIVIHRWLQPVPLKTTSFPDEQLDPIRRSSQLIVIVTLARNLYRNQEPRSST